MLKFTGAAFSLIDRRSYRISVIFWLVYTNFLLMAYECNLRAYLVRTDFEDPVDSDLDLSRRGKVLYITGKESKTS